MARLWIRVNLGGAVAPDGTNCDGVHGGRIALEVQVAERRCPLGRRSEHPSSRECVSRS